MTNTGVFATKEETAKLFEMAKNAANTPCIALSVADGISTGGFAGRAWRTAQEACHGLALEHGLPEITGFYGITQDGEFVQT